MEFLSLMWSICAGGLPARLPALRERVRMRRAGDYPAPLPAISETDRTPRADALPAHLPAIRQTDRTRRAGGGVVHGRGSFDFAGLPALYMPCGSCVLNGLRQPWLRHLRSSLRPLSRSLMD